jgi:hypothetical protein
MLVNVQLIDAESSAHLWTERFDKPIADLFDMQDEIASRLANRLGQELARAEVGRAQRAIAPDSMDHYFLGLAAFNQGATVELFDKARRHYDRALDLDPDNCWSGAHADDARPTPLVRSASRHAGRLAPG